MTTGEVKAMVKVPLHATSGLRPIPVIQTSFEFA